jgi:hypothetical protein
MPYQPYDTGWIRSIFGGLCLLWLLCWDGFMPHLQHEAYLIYYNNIFTPFSIMFNKACTILGNFIILIGEGIIQAESKMFNHFNYIDPIFNGIKHIESMFSNIKINVGPPTFHYIQPNISRHKTSSGKHLCSYYARKRRLKRQLVIVPGSTYYRSKNGNNTPRHDPNHVQNYSDALHTFHPLNDISHCDISWYDAISPYWTEGMIWNGAYVLGHQVVSVTIDPIFISNLPPTHELSGTIQASEARSEGEHVGLRATIALDSGSSIHIFKDAFLLQDIGIDNNSTINY